MCVLFSAYVMLLFLCELLFVFVVCDVCDRVSFVVVVICLL